MKKEDEDEYDNELAVENGEDEQQKRDLEGGESQQGWWRVRG